MQFLSKRLAIGLGLVAGMWTAGEAQAATVGQEIRIRITGTAGPATLWQVGDVVTITTHLKDTAQDQDPSPDAGRYILTRSFVESPDTPEIGPRIEVPGVDAAIDTFNMPGVIPIGLQQTQEIQENVNRGGTIVDVVTLLHAPSHIAGDPVGDLVISGETTNLAKYDDGAPIAVISPVDFDHTPLNAVLTFIGPSATSTLTGTVESVSNVPEPGFGAGIALTVATLAAAATRRSNRAARMKLMKNKTVQRGLATLGAAFAAATGMGASEAGAAPPEINFNWSVPAPQSGTTYNIHVKEDGGELIDISTTNFYTPFADLPKHSEVFGFPLQPNFYPGAPQNPTWTVNAVDNSAPAIQQADGSFFMDDPDTAGTSGLFLDNVQSRAQNDTDLNLQMIITENGILSPPLNVNIIADAIADGVNVTTTPGGVAGTSDKGTYLGTGGNMIDADGSETVNVELIATANGISLPAQGMTVDAVTLDVNGNVTGQVLNGQGGPLITPHPTDATKFVATGLTPADFNSLMQNVALVPNGPESEFAATVNIQIATTANENPTDGEFDSSDNSLSQSFSTSAAIAAPPPGPVLPHCSDGKDNNGNGLTDSADPGCISLATGQHDPALNNLETDMSSTACGLGGVDTIWMVGGIMAARGAMRKRASGLGVRATG